MTDTPIVDEPSGSTTQEPADIFYPKTEAEPTSEDEQSTDEPTSEVKEPADKVEEEDPETKEAEESEDSPEFGDDELFIDLDEEEVSVKQIKEWKQGSLRQSDYTKKTQALADDKREWDADKQGQIDAAVTAKLELLDGNVSTIEALIKEADDLIDWDELREYEPEKFLELKELKEKREKAVADAKLNKGKVSQENDIASQKVELSKLIGNNPEWVKDGKETEAYQKDMSMVITYLNGLNYSEQDQKGILTSGHGQVFIDAARYNQSLNKVEEVKKKVRKIPVTTKPKQSKSIKPKSTQELFYG